MHAAVKPPPAVVVPGPERVVYVDRPVASAVETPAPAPAASVSGAAGRERPLPSRPREVSRPSGRAPRRGPRRAPNAQDGAAALAATRDHERRFPGGQLVQEREAMAVRALVLLGRVPEARARTDRFRARFPGSVLLPVLEAQVGAHEAPK